MASYQLLDYPYLGLQLRLHEALTIGASSCHDTITLRVTRALMAQTDLIYSDVRLKLPPRPHFDLSTSSPYWSPVKRIKCLWTMEANDHAVQMAAQWSKPCVAFVCVIVLQVLATFGVCRFTSVSRGVDDLSFSSSFVLRSSLFLEIELRFQSKMFLRRGMARGHGCKSQRMFFVFRFLFLRGFRLPFFRFDVGMAFVLGIDSFWNVTLKTVSTRWTNFKQSDRLQLPEYLYVFFSFSSIVSQYRCGYTKEWLILMLIIGVFIKLLKR